MHMEWKHYGRNVVKRYMVVIEGWPTNIPFRNLSDASSSLSDLESLLRKWRSGKVYWKAITNSELQELDSARNVEIEHGDQEAPAPRRRRSDYGKKRSAKRADEASKKRRKSRKTVVGSDEEEDEPEVENERVSAGPTASPVHEV